MHKIAIVLLFLSAGCTDILGDYEVERLPIIGDDGHCTSTAQCKDHFHPHAICTPRDGGPICVVTLDASADAGGPDR